MGLKGNTPPRLPVAPAEYDAQYMEQYTNVLRLYFNFLNSAAPAIFASQNVGTTDVVTAMSFAQPNPTTSGASQVSLPTQADLANLRAGDIYYDTTASNVLKIKV